MRTCVCVPGRECLRACPNIRATLSAKHTNNIHIIPSRGFERQKEGNCRRTGTEAAYTTPQHTAFTYNKPVPSAHARKHLSRTEKQGNAGNKLPLHQQVHTEGRVCMYTLALPLWHRQTTSDANHFHHNWRRLPRCQSCGLELLPYHVLQF